MKRIVLIQPRAGYLESFQSAPLHPLALLSVSAALIDGYEIRIVDQRVDPRWMASLADALQGDVLCVGVTSMTGPQISHGLQASRIVREATRAPIVWGGVHPSVLPAQTVAHPLVDFVVEGEGDLAFPEMVRALDRGTDPMEVPGVWTVRSGDAIGARAATILDLGALPPLPYDIIDMEPYIGRDLNGRRRFSIKTSRGCPCRCYFCHQTGKKDNRWRARPAAHVLDEMEWLIRDHGIESFQILDDNFFVDLARAEELLRGIVSRDWRIAYVVNGSRVRDILRMSDDLLRLLARSGCVEMQIGLESGSQRMLDHMRKDQTVEQLRDANARLKLHGIARYYELVSGHRGETIEDLRATARLILELSADDPHVFFSPLENLTPYPGTEAYRQAVEAGMNIPENLEGWSQYGWDRALLPWMDRGRRRMLERFHLFPTVISARVKTERSRVIQALFKLYRPLARFRVRHLIFALPLELILFRIAAAMRGRARASPARPEEV